MAKKKPKTKIKIVEHLGEFKLSDLARETGLLYPQLHRYNQTGANPTLLVLENIAEGLTKLCGKKFTVLDLLETRKPKKKKPS